MVKSKNRHLPIRIICEIWPIIFDVVSIQITVLSVLYNGVTRVVVSKLISQENQELCAGYFKFSLELPESDLSLKISFILEG